MCLAGAEKPHSALNCFRVYPKRSTAWPASARAVPKRVNKGNRGGFAFPVCASFESSCTSVLCLLSRCLIGALDPNQSFGEVAAYAQLSAIVEVHTSNYELPPRAIRGLWPHLVRPAKIWRVVIQKCNCRNFLQRQPSEFRGRRRWGERPLQR